MKSNKDLEKMRDSFRKCADIIDELLSVEGEDNEAEAKYEAILGRFMVEMMKLQSSQSNL